MMTQKREAWHNWVVRYPIEGGTARVYFDDYESAQNYANTIKKYMAPGQGYKMVVDSLRKEGSDE